MKPTRFEVFLMPRRVVSLSRAMSLGVVRDSAPTKMPRLSARVGEAYASNIG